MTEGGSYVQADAVAMPPAQALLPGQLTCGRCGSTEGVELESARTAYARPTPTVWSLIDEEWLDKEPPDLNAPIPLCRECAIEHHEYWDELWGQVNQL